MKDTILLVEDDVPIRKAFSAGFSGEGYEVFAVESAEEALDVLKKASVEVVFLDLNLPGMSGLELCKEIKRRNPIACVFAVTGHASLFELTDWREAGFEDYFLKPVRMGQLFKVAEQAFERIGRWKKL